VKQSLGAKTLLYPTPVLVVGTYHADGRPNVMTAAWGGIACSKPPCVSVSLRAATATHGNIVARKAFTISLPSRKQAAAADCFGLASGRKLDKFAATGLTPFRPSFTEEMKTWTRGNLKAFLESVADERLSALWYTIAFTGMRRGEALGLRWSDVDLENARLAVRRALIPINREVVVSEPKTAKGRRVIAIDPGTVEVLKAQAARQLEEQGRWDEAWVDSGLVFTCENGEALDPESVSRYFRQAVKKSLLPKIRLHDLRHTHATMALQAGIHPKVVSERLGHATISITLDTYSHAIPAMQEEAAALIVGLVFAGE